MKTKFFVVVLMVAVVGFAACGPKPENKSDDNNIKTFSVNNVPYEVKGTDIKCIYEKVSENTWKDLPKTAVEPKIELSHSKATIDPPASTKIDFNKDGEVATYTVTAENGAKKTYKVNVTRSPF